MKDMSQLVGAIINGNASLVDSYLETITELPTDSYLHKPDGSHHSLLRFAARAVAYKGGQAHASILKKLVSLSTKEHLAKELVYSASEDSYLEEVKTFLNAGVSPDLKDADGESALGIAACNGNVKVTYWLLVHGADPNQLDRYGEALTKDEASVPYGLLQSARDGALLSPRLLLPADDILETRLRKWLAGIKKLGTENPNERFYVLGIDGGLLCANGEHAFAKTLKEYEEREDERDPTNLTVAELSEEQRLEAQEFIDMGSSKSLEDWVSSENEWNRSSNEEKDRAGNRYRDDAEAIRHLKYNAGDWSFMVPDAEADSDVEIDISPLSIERKHDDRLWKDIMIELLEANRKVIGARLRLSDGFVLLAPKHVY